MAEFSGSELKRKREEMHIPLEQVASETRIRLSILQDLEDEEYSELSSSAQIKGFLRIYADYLGLNQDDEQASDPLDGDVEKASADETKASLEDSDAESNAESPSQPEEAVKEPIEVAPSAEAESIPDPTAVEEEATPKQETESQKMLAQLGRELSARRRYLNLEWDVIIQQTRLHRNTLRALENGDLDAFFAPLEFRKDLQTYARFLNLDVESIMVQYAEALQKRHYENLPAKRIKRDSSKPASRVLLTIRRFFTLDLFFGMFIVLGILGFLIWGISNMRERSDEQPVATETIPAIIDFILTTPTASEPTHEPEPEEVEEVAIPTATAFFVQARPEEGFSLTLLARQNIWIRVYADDKLAYEGRLAAGDVKSFSADEGLGLETSNISGLEIAFQGNAIEPISRPFGTPARFLFNQNGMQERPLFDVEEEPDLNPTPGAP